MTATCLRPINTQTLSFAIFETYTPDERRASPASKLNRNRIKNTKKRTFAMANEAPAMPMKPNNAATIARMKKKRAHDSIGCSSILGIP